MKKEKQKPETGNSREHNDRTNLYLALILSFGFLIAVIPAFIFSYPAVQTDGATHYVNAKIFAETGSLGSEIPKYNWIGIAERKLSEYPPLTTITLGFLIKIFGNDLIWINGLYAAIFLVIGNFFIYLFTRELTGKKGIALLVTLFSTLNVRAYYTLFSGILPAFTSFCLSFPAMYFALKYFNNKKTKDLLMSILFNGLVWFTYIQQGIFLLILEIALFLGVLFSKKIRIEFPKIKIKFKEFKAEDYKTFFYLIIPAFAIALFVVVKYMFAAKARAGIITELLYSLLSATSGYQRIWENMLIMDEPIMVLFAFAGIIYLIYKQYWKSLMLIAAGLIILFVNALIPEGLWIKIYLLRFYLIFFVIMAVSASIILYEFSSNKKIRKTVVAIILVSLLLQAAKLGVFYKKMAPAINDEEYASSMFLKQHKESSILYIQNEDVSSSFRDFKWIVVYAQTNNYDYASANYRDMLKPPEMGKYDYVYVYNKNFLKQEENEAFASQNVAFEGKSVIIYKIEK